MQYALGKDAETAPTSGWAASVPTATEAGTYHVWYRAAGDADHRDSEPACVEATIAAKPEPKPDPEPTPDPEPGRVEMFRLYNPYSGEHFYTTGEVERDVNVGLGWIDEGVGWFSAGEDCVPLWRQYNPNAVVGTHNYTTGEVERDHLVSIGWVDEGIGWYGLA